MSISIISTLLMFIAIILMLLSISEIFEQYVIIIILCIIITILEALSIDKESPTYLGIICWSINSIIWTIIANSKKKLL